MKISKIFAAFIGIALITACGGETNPDLKRLVSSRDSLKSIRMDIDKQLAKIEANIAELDSSIDKKLVTTLVLSKGTFKHYFEVYGSVQSDKAATLYAETNGVLRQIAVTEGQEVKKGQLLIALDAEILNRNLSELETQLDLATTLFEKQEKLWKQNIGSEVQYLEAKNRKEAVENQIATLKEQQGRSNIRAPFDGVVDKIYPKVGELAGMQSPMVRLVNLDRLYVTADVSERYVNELSEGDSVDLVANYKDTIPCKISRLGKFINPNNRSFEVRVDLSSTVASLRPNSMVTLKINDVTKVDVISVPSSVVMQDGNGNDYVFVVRADGDELKAERRQISTGVNYQGRVVVESGLEATDQIIEKGARTVRNGDIIEVISI